MSFNSERYEITKSDNGYWVKDKYKGRSRFVVCSPETMATFDVARLEQTRRSFKEGHHEPMTLYRDASGEIGVPWDANEIPSEAVEVFTVDNLKDADRICAEMQRQMERKFEDDGHFSRTMEEYFDSPRSRLLEQQARAISQMEHDTIDLLIKDLDREESDRRKLSTSVHFAWRES